jgi:ubiquinone/menaquinone biosynthesis C-methylase UbiE
MAKRSPEQWQAFYSHESTRYDDRRYATSYGRVFARLHHEALTHALIGMSRETRLVELACGTGHITALLQQLGYTVIACDLTPEMMEYAKTRCSGGEPTPSFIRASAFRLPFRDSDIDALISTRFLHLFSQEQQRAVLSEFQRVLRPGGRLIIDFDNQSARWLMVFPYLLYNLLRYHRFGPDTHYNTITSATTMLQETGFVPEHCDGLGGTHLLSLSWIAPELAIRFGRLHRGWPLRVAAEQFLITAHRK